MYYVIHVMIVNLYGMVTHMPRGPFVCYYFKSVHVIKNLCQSSCRLTLHGDRSARTLSLDRLLLF